MLYNKVDRKITQPVALASSGDIHRLASPVGLIAICLKLESVCAGKKNNILAVSYLNAIRNERTPIMELIKSIWHSAEDNRPAVIETIGEDLLISLESLDHLTGYEREHFNRTGTILPGSRFIHWSPKHRTT